MKHPMQNERGYSLLTTFAIMLIIITLALTLLFLTSNGLNRNTMNQQTVQANAQSDKGIDRLLAEIQKTLQEGVGEDGIPPNLFISLLEDTLNRYGCDAHPIQGESVTGKYEACIVSYEDAEDLIDGGTTPLRKEVTFRSVGSAGDIDKTVESVIELGAESIPETMKYAIGANIMSKRPSNGEGNLIIHGGAHIQGDMKVDHNIATYDRGYWYYNADRWEPSTLPTAIPTKGTRNAKLVLGNKAYSITQRPYDYEAHINRSNLGSYAKQAPLEELFEKGKAPRIVQRNPVVKPINIAEQRTNYYFNKGKELVFDNNFYEDIVISNNSQPHSDVIPFLKRKDWWGNYYYTRNADVYLFNSNHFNRLAVERHLFLREGNHQFNEGVYVGGHLLIGKETNSNNPRNYEPITLNGNIYVKGNVTITGNKFKK